MKRLIVGSFLLLIVQFQLISQVEKYAKVKVFISENTEIQSLYESGIDIDHYHSGEDQSISFYLNHSEIPLLEESGLNYRITIPDCTAFYEKQAIKDQSLIPHIKKQQKTANNFGYGSMGGFYTFSEMVGKLDEMSNLYPNLATAKFSIGTSVQGRTIWAVKISDNPNVDENEPVVYYDALHHAREPLSMAVTINYMFWLLENYNIDPRVKHIVDQRELYFVPCVNPDGYEYNRQTNPNGGGYWRKNRKNVGSGCTGVDLNRNYSFGYANNGSCSSSDPCRDTYRGTGSFSEPETTAVRNLLSTINPKTAFSIHSTAGNYLMPYGYDTSPPQYNLYSEWASDFLAENDYPYGVTYQMLGYTSCGTTRDYLHSEGIYGWTPEIDGSGFWPAQSEIFGLVDENVYPLFYQAWIAGGFTDIQSHSIIGNANPGSSFQVQVEVKNKGVGAASSNVEVSILAADPSISISGNNSIGTVNARSRRMSDNFSVNVGSNFSRNEVDLTIVVSQGGAETDRQNISIPIGNASVIISDNAESGSSYWSASGNGISWGINNDDSYDGSRSFGDSNNGNSRNGTTNYFTLNQNLNLSSTTRPVLEFMSKWSLASPDYARLQISTNNGSSWSTLKTFQQSESWHQELFDLSSYIGSSVRFRFLMVTNNSIPGDGFYFDTFSLKDYQCSDCNACTTIIDQFPQNESFESGLGTWAQSIGDDLNWTRDANGTPSSNTGPTSGSDGSWYAYIEASSPNYPSKTAGLESPCYDLSNVSQLNLSFDYHMYGSASSMNLEVQVSVDGGISWSNAIWNTTGNQGNQWNSASIDLSTYVGQLLNIRFFGTTGEIWRGDIAIDRISITTDATCTTAGQPCDDGDACTENDVYDGDCSCSGTFADSDNDGVCNAADQCPNFNDQLIGTVCDDLNACTINDVYNNNCNCVGQLQDSDNDGVCDTNDVCPGFDDHLIGSTCDDLDPCTIGETYSTNCNCEGGSLLDQNNNGVCDLNEACSGSLPISESFENGIGNWVQGSDDDLEWRRDSGGTPSSNTGPTSGSDGSWYMYIEASSPNYPSKTASLISECLLLGNSGFPTLNFSYHMYGTATTMKLDVQISLDGGSSWSSPIWSISGNQGNQWNSASVDLSGYSGASVNLRFFGTTGATWRGDIAIDEIELITNNICSDFGTPCDDGDPCLVGETYDADCNCTAGVLLDSNANGICDLNEGCGEELISFEDFESGYGFWNDGGADANRVINDAVFANSGSYCVRLQDNTSTSVITTNTLDLSSYEYIEIDFSYITRSMDNASEDFWFQISNNGGQSYTTIEEWNLNDEFVNNVRYTGNVSVQGPFGSNIRLRFRCDASTNYDWVYLDDINIIGCAYGMGISFTEDAPSEKNYSNSISKKNIDNVLQIHPNPAIDQIMVQYESGVLGKDSAIIMYNSAGIKMEFIKVNRQEKMISIDVSNFVNGIYILQLQTEHSVLNKKFIVQK